MPRGFIINDDNYRDHLTPTINGQKVRKGYRRVRDSIRNARALPFEALGIPLIDEADLDDHLRELEKQQATLEEFIRGLNGGPLNQLNTNLCWSNATVQAAAVAMAIETGVYEMPSAASVACPATGFRNVGGYGQQALNQMIKTGWNTHAEWPNAAIDRKYYTEENKAKAAKRKPLEYVAIRSWIENISAQVAGYVVSSGLGWWRHQILNCGLQLKTHRQRILNSWGTSWGEQGFGWLDGSKRWDGDGVVIFGLMPT